MRLDQKLADVLITGPTGVGKAFIAYALAHSACRHGFRRAVRTECPPPPIRVGYRRVETDRIPKMPGRQGSPRYVCLSWTTGETAAAWAPRRGHDVLEIVDDRSQLSSTRSSPVSYLSKTGMHQSSIRLWPTQSSTVCVHNPHSNTFAKRESDEESRTKIIANH